MKQFQQFCVFGVSAALSIAGDLLAAGPDVAIVAAASNTADAQNDSRFADVRDKLMETGLFNSITIINATGIGDGVGTPPLEDLLQFDAIITWSNVSYDDAVTMGDTLADFVDAGGGVVVGVFANTTTTPNRFLQGRWQTGDYIAIPQGGGFDQGPGELGNVLLPTHPIFNEVTAFQTNWGINEGGIFGGYRPSELTLTPGSTLVAQWDTGHTLVAVAPNKQVVELGFHPVSSDVVNSAYWTSSTDGGLIMANALLYTIAEATGCGRSDHVPNLHVDVFDVLAVLDQWGDCGEPCPGSECVGDSDANCTVDIFDLLAVLEDFGICYAAQP